MGSNLKKDKIKEHFDYPILSEMDITELLQREKEDLMRLLSQWDPLIYEEDDIPEIAERDSSYLIKYLQQFWIIKYKWNRINIVPDLFNEDTKFKYWELSWIPVSFKIDFDNFFDNFEFSKPIPVREFKQKLLKLFIKERYLPHKDWDELSKNLIVYDWKMMPFKQVEYKRLIKLVWSISWIRVINWEIQWIWLNLRNFELFENYLPQFMRFSDWSVSDYIQMFGDWLNLRDNAQWISQFPSRTSPRMETIFSKWAKIFDNSKLRRDFFVKNWFVPKKSELFSKGVRVYYFSGFSGMDSEDDKKDVAMSV